jgi:hypothetical protein
MIHHPVAVAVALIVAALGGIAVVAWAGKGRRQGTCDFCSWRDVRQPCSCGKACLSVICPRKEARVR